MNKIKTGKYKHYKGGEYEVIGEARHSETLEPMVVYQGLYKSEEFGDNPIWIRPLEMFVDTVTVDGKEIQRFEKLD